MRAFFRVSLFSFASLALLTVGWMTTWGDSCGGLLGLDPFPIVFLMLFVLGGAYVLFAGASFSRAHLFLGTAMLAFLGYGLGAMPPLYDGAAMLVYFGYHLAPPCGVEFGFALRVAYVSLAGEILLCGLVGYRFILGRRRIAFFRVGLWLALIAIMSAFLYHIEGSFGFIDIPEPGFFYSGLLSPFHFFSSIVRT